MLDRSGQIADMEFLSLLDFLVNMSASADVLAQAKVEIGLGAIPEGKNVCSIFSFPPNQKAGSSPFAIQHLTDSETGYHQVAW